MRYLLTTLLFIFLGHVVNSQNKFDNKEYGFEMSEPDNWLQADNSALIENLKKFEIIEENLAKILTNNKGTLPLTSFSKYNPKTRSGLIPTVQVNVRLNIVNDFARFKTQIVASANSFRNYFDDFAFITEPKDTLISGINSVYFVGKFSMKTQNGQKFQVRSRTFAIPCKGYFFQLNFTDDEVGENCQVEFDRLVKSIRITAPR